jgi:hypothetical protein
MPHGLVSKWARLTPKMHTDVVTSLRTSLTRPCSEEEQDECLETWETMAKLPNLTRLFVKMAGFETWDDWSLENQQKLAAGLEQIQQQGLKEFDLVFCIDGTWFPDDCYLRLSYNSLEWDTFLLDLQQHGAFDGVHPRCRAVGMNGFLHNHPVLDDMPTKSELVEWIMHFSCNAAYGYPDPEGYDWDATGESARHGVEDWEERRAEGQRERERLWDECDKDKDGASEKWDWDAICRVADLLDSDNQRPNRWKWKYPERPGWIEPGV